MRPLYSSKTFSGNQEVTWTVTVYETPHTVASKGIIYRPATPTSTFGDSIDFSTATVTQMHTHFDSNTSAGIKDSNGDEIYGRVPVIYDYWGTQAPLGVYTAGQVALRYKGYVKTAGDYGLGFFGNGNVKVFVNSGVLSLNGNNYKRFSETAPAYTTSLSTYAEGDQIDIFYWGKALDWGGLGARVWTNSGAASASGIDWELMRDQDILSASWMDDDVTVVSTNLYEATQVDIEHADGQISTCRIPVVLGGDNDIMGWQYDHVNKYLSRINDTQKIKRGYLVKVTGGYTGEAHPQFTGHVVDIEPGKGIATIVCESVEGRLTNQMSENLPDRLSYAINGYYERVGVSNPAFGVPAYDHWPYELALKDMLTRAWIDSSLLNGKKEMRRVGQSTSEDGGDLFKVRSLGGDYIRIQRQANYGNPYSDSSLPEDDEYLTTSEITQSLYDRVTSLTDRIGYCFRSDYEGNIVVRPKNNSSSLTMIDSGGTDTVHPAAIGGVYQKFVGSGWSKVISNIKASRIELVVVRSSGFGTINVALTRTEDAWTDSININLDYDEDVLYYDQVLTVDLSNITSFPVVEGEDYATYSMTITPVGASGGTEFGLNALRVFETDPLEPISEFTLSSLQNAIELQGKSNYRDHVNDAIVTGARRATLTDSQKVFENIIAEYVLSRSTDVHSILDPTAVNYDGRKITAFLSDASIADKALADWTSRALVSRYRLPEPTASVVHTAIPSLELYDPMYVTDAQFEQFDASKVYWVTAFKTQYKPGYAVQNIEVSPFANIPSYEPREEIDISLYNNKPVINLSITYPSLSGSGTVSNPVLSAPTVSTLIVDSGTIANDGSDYMTVSAGTASPGTELLFIEELGGADIWQFVPYVHEMHYFKNNPYQKFYTKNGTRLDLDFEMADGSSAYAMSTFYISVGDTAVYSYHKIQDAYSGTSPFYDPYYSELPVSELITINFDALVSGYYRVSIVDARKSQAPTTVAWLTESSADDIDKESHWSYVTAGPNKTYTWDGVDNLGTWNKEQSEEYSWRQRGNFPMVENPLIGRGFYAQNDTSTQMTHISSELESSVPAYPIGKYATFYVKIEVMRDTSSEILSVESRYGGDPSDIESGEIAGHLLDTSANYLASRYIHYHLPQPNTATVSITDWNGVSDYDPENPGSSWSSTPNTDCTFREGQPVKLAISTQKRKGAKFASADDTSVMVHRVVHLSAHIWDQAAIISPDSWNAKSASIHKKRLISRRFNVDDHTLIYKDEYFTEGENISDWVFYPSLFVKDFGRGEESLEYLHYLQLTEVPMWNPGRATGEDRSRFLMAMMGYLFYFSVFTQDRSGRLNWCVDTSFVDKSKILGNTDTTDFPDDMERHQRRTIYTRQWWDYNLLDSILGTDWGVDDQFYGGYADRFDYHSRGASDALYPTAGGYYNNNVESGNIDPYVVELYNQNRMKLDGISGTAAFYRELGTMSGGAPATTELGSWTWETDGFVWIPSVSRDFHPFYIVPPMALASYLDEDNKTWWEQNFWVAISDTNDEAKHDNFFSAIEDRTCSDYTNYRMRPGRVVEDHFENSTVPINIIQYQKQDDLKHFEHCRGGYTNAGGEARDRIHVVGGDPYYVNTKLYRHFRRKFMPKNQNKTRWYNDVWRKGWFFVTFRHTYNWESASLFPVGEDGMLLSGALDSDKTASPLSPIGYDAGAYTGWKDDHPSAQQQGTWVETGAAAEIHWRNDNTNNGALLNSNYAFQGQAGGANTIEDPDVNLTSEDMPSYYNPRNIFMQKELFKKLKNNSVTAFPYQFVGMMPVAVGPRLPQTRRVLMATTLVNTRRTAPIT